MGQTGAVPGPPECERKYPHFTNFIEIAPGFWHLRVPFYVGKGPLKLDISNHMSVCQLSSGAFVCIDAVQLSSSAKAELDQITDNGQLLVAVVTTHPFHTSYIEALHELYPSSATRKWFGCPRHLRKFPNISWAGDLNTCQARNALEPDIAMQIPAGMEFVDPQPASTNHAATVFVLHRPSKTLFVDDCLMYFDKPSTLMRIAGKSAGSLHFHSMLMNQSLYPTAEAPIEFQSWLTKLLEDWQFDHLVAAHIGNCYCDAHGKVQKCLTAAEGKLRRRSERNARKAQMPQGLNRQDRKSVV